MYFNILAFNKTMSILEKQGKSITSFNYNNKEIADHIYSAINSTQFLGISVSVITREKIGRKNLKYVNILGVGGFQFTR